MVTLTIRHSRDMSLAATLAAVRGPWRALQSRAGYRAFRRLTIGSVRAMEITDGDNGWHPHLHVLYFMRPGVLPADVAQLTEGLTSAWRRLVGEELGAIPSVERAVDVRWLGADAARYVSKVGKEIAMADSKSGRDPFALLDVQGEGARAAGARFIEYATATRGAQSLAWSKGLRATLEQDDVLTDEELLQRDEPDGVVVTVVDRAEWNAMLRSGSLADFLAEVEARWCDRVPCIRRE